MRVMGIDLGDARTGVAVSDALGMLTGSTSVIESWNKEKTALLVAESRAKNDDLANTFQTLERIWEDYGVYEKVQE